MAEYKIHNRMTHWQKTYPAWISFAAIAFLLAVWEIICSTGLISSLFLPAPSAILTALGKLIISGEISRSLTASLYRILLGFALGSIIGLLVGLVTGCTHRQKDPAESFGRTRYKAGELSLSVVQRRSVVKWSCFCGIGSYRKRKLRC